MIITGSQFHQGGKWLARTIAKYHCLTVLSDDGKGLHTTRTSLKKKPQQTNNNKKPNKKPTIQKHPHKTQKKTQQRHFIRHRLTEKPVSFHESPDELQPGFLSADFSHTQYKHYRSGDFLSIYNIFFIPLTYDLSLSEAYDCN